MRRLMASAAMTLAVAAATAGGVVAGEVPVETGALNGATVVLHVYPFLDPSELATLRLVMTNAQALALFLPDNKGYAAIAVAPDEGFIRDGQPVASAVAMGGLPDAATAAAQAQAACDGKRAASGAACVVVLEVSP